MIYLEYNELTIAVTKHHDQRNLRKERFIGLCFHITGGIQDRNWSQELMQRSCRSPTYYLVTYGLLSYRTQNYQPRGGTAHNV